MVDPKQIFVVFKSEKQKKRKKVLTSFYNIFLLLFQFSTFSSQFSLLFPFFPCLFFPDTSAKISRSQVSGGHSAPLPVTPLVTPPPCAHTPHQGHLAYSVKLCYCITNYGKSNLPLQLCLFYRPGSVVANFVMLYENPPGDITDPNTIEDEVENFVRSYLQFLINSGNLGSFPIVPGPVPPVTVEGKQVYEKMWWIKMYDTMLEQTLIIFSWMDFTLYTFKSDKNLENNVLCWYMFVFLECSISVRRYTGTKIKQDILQQAVLCDICWDLNQNDNCIMCLLNWWHLYTYLKINNH